ncbi:MAG: hypothetical protein AAFX05_10580 [Planctomycetota bacterium]
MDRLAKLRSLFEADPSDADVPYMIAQEHMTNGDFPAALEWFDRCLALDADYHYAYYHKARALESMENVDAAASTLRDGLARAQAAGNGKASGEISEFLASLGQ